MSSENKTPNIGLNQWQGNEYAKREDFVNDNLIIDREIKDLQIRADEVEQNAKKYTDTTASKKVDKVAGKKLSTEDYTTTDKNKIAGIQVGANKYVHPSKHSASIITQNATHRFTTDQEKAYWNGLEALLKAYADAATAGIVNSAPETLNTLNKIAQALSDNPNFASTIANQIKNKVDKVSGKKLSSNDYTTADKNKLAGIQSGAQVNRGISNSVTSTSSTTNASSKASKTAYDKAVSALNIANTKEPKITKKTGFNLNKSDSVTSGSSSTLATSKAVKIVNDKFVRFDNMRQYKAQISLSTKYGAGNGNIVFDTVDEDVGGFYNSSYPTRLTIPCGLGIKRVIVIYKSTASVNTDRLGSYQQKLRKNGADTLYAGTARLPYFTTSIDVVDGDYFQLYQTSHSNPHSIYEGAFLRIEVLE